MQQPEESQSTPSRSVEFSIVPVTSQARGAFDLGRITERKPISFPQEGGPQSAIGPLFYWAWAESEVSGTIAMHPHQGFEILSYVLEGELRHRDTLGNASEVGPGGVQVQQAGSGLSHEEVTGPESTKFFQIWFQPDLEEALTRPAAYLETSHEELPATTQEGVTVKTILGEGSPVSLETDVAMHDVEISPGSRYRRELPEGRAIAAVAISGNGSWLSSAGPEEVDGGAAFEKRDLAVIRALESNSLSVEPLGDEPLRLVLVEVPTEVPYPLIG